MPHREIDMPTSTVRKITSKSEASAARSKAGNALNIKRSSLDSKFLSGEALLIDMQAYRKKVAATPETAKAFLTRLGVMSASGKAKKLIRG
jgi:hypothetical protein